MANTSNNASILKIIFRAIPVLGLLCLVAGFGYAISQARFDGASYALCGVGVLLFLTLFLKAEVANLKYYLHVFIYSFLVLGLGVIVYMFAQKYTKKVDLTEQKMFSLSPLSEKVLKNLKQDVTVNIFFTTPDAFGEITSLYKDVTDKVKWKVIDARTKPVEARKVDEDAKNGDIFVTAGTKKKRLSVAELQDNYENVLTNAIVEVTRDKNIKIYFLSGHGELAYEAPDPAMARQQRRPQPSLGAFRSYLTQRAIDTAQLDLAKSGFVPKDASLVVVAGPTSDLQPTEATALQNYLDQDGKLLVLLDVPQRNFSAAQANLTGLLKKYSIEAPDKIILDLSAMQLTGNPVQPVAAFFDKEHPITREMTSRSSRFLLSLTRPVMASMEATQGLKVTELIKTSDQSWTEELAKVLAQSRLAPPAKDDLKPQPLAVAVSKAAPPSQPGQPPQPEPEGGMRLVAFGSSELIQDAFLSNNQMAVELMLNTINWLTQQEDMIAVPPRQLKGTPIVLDDAQLRVIFLFSVILIPALLFFGGVSYSMLRRRR